MKAAIAAGAAVRFLCRMLEFCGPQRRSMPAHTMSLRFVMKTLMMIIIVAENLALGHAVLASGSKLQLQYNISSTMAPETTGQVTPLKMPATKRNIKVHTTNFRASPKSYDPPPEFYRGPGSTSSTSTTASSYVVPPITVSERREHNKYEASDGGVYPASSFNFHDWQLPRPPGSGYGQQDRISATASHYGTLHGGNAGSGYGAGPTGVGVGPAPAPPPYPYEGRPYTTTIEYVPPHEVGSNYYHHHHPHHPHQSHQHHSSHQHIHSGGTAAGGHSGEGIHFDLYRGNHFAGSAGGDYAYGEEHETILHKENEFARKALLAKSFLIPLASAAVLGIAAALVTNPFLLQLGTVSAGVAPGVVGPAVVGKRKRRHVKESSNVPAGLVHAVDADSPDNNTRAYWAHRRQAVRS